MQRRTFLAATGAVASVTLAGCQSGLSSSEYDIGMSPNAFQPERHTVSVGDTVVWGNTSSRGHSVTAYESSLPDGAAYFASGGADSQAAAREQFPDAGYLGPGATYEHTFEVAGEYNYFCIPHEREGMVGIIVVE